MHERHPREAGCYCIIFKKVVALLLGDHARAGVTPSKWPAETALAVAAGYLVAVAQAINLEQMHRGNGLRDGGFEVVF